MLAGLNSFCSNSKTKVLSESQIQKIHQATLHILEQTGVHIEDPESLELLYSAGADVNNTN